MSELLPCPTPWCDGSEPRIYKGVRNGYYVTCVGCESTTNEYGTKAEAVKTWNTRAPDPSIVLLTAEISRLFQLLDDIDTAGDMFKPEKTNYFRCVEKKHRERFDGITSTDGCTLSIKGEPVNPDPVAVRFAELVIADCERIAPQLRDTGHVIAGSAAADLDRLANDARRVLREAGET